MPRIASLIKDSAVMADIAQNRRLLAETFYSDKKIIEPAVEKILERRKREIQAAIIASPYPKSWRQRRRWKHAPKYLKLVRGGANFEVRPGDSSDDKRPAPATDCCPLLPAVKLSAPSKMPRIRQK